MSFNEIVNKDIKTRLDSSLGLIGNIGKAITVNIDKDLDVNEKTLLGPFDVILDFIGDMLHDNDVVSDTISNLTKMFIDFSGLFEPLLGMFMKLFGKIIGSISEAAGNPFKEILKNLGKLDGTVLKIGSGAQMKDLMTWINEVGSNILGVRPFAIMEGKGNYIDFERTHPYYVIMQTIIMVIFSATMFVSNFKTYLEFPYGVYLRELYELEKLSLPEYISLKRREFIDSDTLKAKAKYLGYDSEALKDTLKITEFYPSARDLIDFAVREAFEPDAELFIHGKNAIPTPFLEFGKKVGLTDEWIKKFWHSHWRLLGVGQILDAFHRNLVSEVDLLDYLRRLDYTEADQKLILGMSYKLPTRVDMRRVFENGLISSFELYEHYGKLGFSDKDKMLLTNLAKQLRFIEQKDLRKLYIEQYEAGFLTESEIRSKLANTGLDSDEISLYLSFSDSQKELDFKLELKKQIELRFYEGIIDFDELIEQLRSLGVSNREITRVERNAALFNFRKPKMSTIAELKRYLLKDIITIDKFVYHALRLGYSIENIEWILIDIEWLK